MDQIRRANNHIFRNESSEVFTPTLFVLKISVVILLAGTLIGTYGLLKEEPMICDFTNVDLDHKLALSICIVQGTRFDYGGEVNSSNITNPSNITINDENKDPDLGYVKMVPINLFLCGMLMILPSYLTKFCKISFIGKHEDEKASIIASKFKKERKSLKVFQNYLLWLAIYGVFAAVTFFTLNSKLNNQLISYGYYSVFNQNMTDPMAVLFPTDSVCDLRFQSNGEMDNHKIRCSVPLNYHYAYY